MTPSGPDIPPTGPDALGYTSPPVEGAFPVRRVIFIAPHPTDIKRRMYRLECGHTVNRPAQGNKAKAVCVKCGRRRHSRDPD